MSHDLFPPLLTGEIIAETLDYCPAINYGNFLIKLHLLSSDRTYYHCRVKVKTSKYSSLPSSHIFQPLALESLGLINTTGCSLLSKLGCRLTGVSGDPRETTHLFWRVSLAVQRYNPAAFRGTSRIGLVPLQLF